ncbi:hypothetical protein EXIGLDRAFT_747852 [Exidia glandulosa HHB12029]|uniref:C2 NT-type domain-containing protein n=1 Tax=Exidia glandulosa HHB12029 TaxID=1314781 RepID=A0A165K955_EXIGL|nr:hypothetical protein EXIGLDRAFT_747852 [Exidia glandulosa HHB12029]
MAATHSSSSSSGRKDAAGPSGSGHGGGGIRNHLRNVLVARRATFHVRLTVHQLSALPVASGYFAVTWKLKNVSGDAIPKRQRAGRKLFRDGQPTSPAPAVTSFPHNVQDLGNASTSSGKGKERAHDDDDGDTPTIPPSATLVASVNPSETTLASDTPENIHYTADSRGSTNYAQLRDYNVVWDHTIDTAVDMHIDRETGDLKANQLTLTIVQQGHPKHPIGNVLLNLAEYADAGVVTRKHLLRGTKTNATLKVTLQVEYLSGEKQYRPPPLRKSEILAGISGLLSTMLSEFEELQSPTGASAIFSGEGIIPYAEDWTFHPTSGAYFSMQIRPPLDRGKHSSYNLSPSPSTIRSPNSSGIFHDNAINAADTERVIESIFNPFPSTSQAPSPFTYYAPHKAPAVRPRTAPSLSAKDLLAVPGQSDALGVLNGAAGTQEHLQAVQGSGRPSPASRTDSIATTTTSANGSSRPHSRSGQTDVRKMSLDLDSSARSVAFSMAASESGEGSVESHQSHNSDQSHNSGKKPGWLKRLLSPHSSRTQSKDSVVTTSSSSNSNGSVAHARRVGPSAVTDARPVWAHTQ